MNHIYLLLLLLLQAESLFAGNNANCSRNDFYSHNPNDTLIKSQKQDSLITELVDFNFNFDDSLLIASYPEAGIKPVGTPQPAPMLFQHSLKMHYTPKDTTYRNFLIITTESLYDSLSVELKTYADILSIRVSFFIWVKNAKDRAYKKQKKNYSHRGNKGP